MSRSERRAARIRDEASIEVLLAHYGYPVVPGANREQQFPCDLHGDGNDGKPSARCYPENNSWYCWACGRARDAIQTVREKEGFSFRDALQTLERLFKLPELPWEDGDREVQPTDLLEESLHLKPIGFQDTAKRAERLLRSLSESREVPLHRVLSLYEEYDKLVSFSESDPEVASDDMVRLIDCLKSTPIFQ